MRRTVNVMWNIYFFMTFPFGILSPGHGGSSLCLGLMRCFLPESAFCIWMASKGAFFTNFCSLFKKCMQKCKCWSENLDFFSGKVKCLLLQRIFSWKMQALPWPLSVLYGTELVSCSEIGYRTLAFTKQQAVTSVAAWKWLCAICFLNVCLEGRAMCIWMVEVL